METTCAKRFVIERARPDRRKCNLRWRQISSKGLRLIITGEKPERECVCVCVGGGRGGLISMFRIISN